MTNDDPSQNDVTIVIDMDPKDLIAKAKAGDKAAFGQLYSKYFLPVFRYIYLRINNKKEAEDLTQNVFLKVYQSIDRYQSTESDPLAYFFTISRNTVIDFYRRKKAVSLESEEQALEIPDRSDNPEEALLRDQTQNEIISAVRQLPEDQREVITLKFINELPNDQIATILGKNEPAIRQIQHRALKKLHELLNGGTK